MSRVDAVELTQRLLAGIKVDSTDDGVDRLVEVAGRLPYLIHLLAAWLRDQGVQALTPDVATHSLAAVLDDPERAKGLQHVHQRVPEQYGNDAALALALLDLCADTAWRTVDDIAVALPETAREDLVRVVHLLVQDHDLERRDRQFRWRYPVIAVIWKHHRLLG